MRITLVLSLLLFVAFGGMAQVWPSRQIAEGQSVTLKARSTDALSYLWFLNGEPINGEHDEILITQQEGLYTVIGLNDVCASELSDPVEIIINEQGKHVEVDIQISKLVDPDPVYLNDEFEYQLYVVNNSEYTANKIEVIDDLPPSLEYISALPEYTGEVKHQVSTHKIFWHIESLIAGQTEELRIRVKALEPGWIENTATAHAEEPDPSYNNNTASVNKQVLIFKIPNVFTPNGDGINDYFEIEGLQDFPENEFMVYNRWGNMVYHSKSYKNDWDGAHLNEGTYYYILRVLTRGKWDTFKGYITLIRR
ncbi:MAG TPA: gliding motility-associated C-terminal domain-containing protein [Sphingobacterium sp.]|nr:gliding motility-associated C-terminal domain-containing protein [Sphingobacterium sp.]